MHASGKCKESLGQVQGSLRASARKASGKCKEASDRLFAERQT